MEILVVTLLAALAFSPLLLAYHRQKHGRSPKLAMAVNIVAVFALCLLTTGMGIGGHALAAGTEAAASAASSTGWGYLAMADGGLRPGNLWPLAAVLAAAALLCGALLKRMQAE